MLITPLRVRRAHTKAIRLMLVSRSARLKPRPLLKWVRTTSPSSTSTLRPRALRRCSTAWARVLLPALGRPVNQMVTPLLVMQVILQCSRLVETFLFTNDQTSISAPRHGAPGSPFFPLVVIVRLDSAELTGGILQQWISQGV